MSPQDSPPTGPEPLPARDRSDSDWQARLALVVETMREMSLQTDPQEMVRNYGRRIEQLLPVDRRISLSRRDLEYPAFRVTRDNTWTSEVNPWREKSRLPLYSGGLIADLIYGNAPVVIDNLEVAPEDPAADLLRGYRSLLAIPMYDQGEALNMVLMFRRDAAAFDHAQVPDAVWRSNLFGRATSNLVLKEQLREAYNTLDRELAVVGNIQRSLLPTTLPEIPSLELAVHYQPATRAGGDYYDFFPLPDGQWGLLIADVSGHGTPAAVLMAITQCLVHSQKQYLERPDQVLEHLNRQLAERYTHDNGIFVTAFYAVYDPRGHRLIYSNAGHNPPRLKRRGTGLLQSLDQISGLPLGIWEGGQYDATETEKLSPGDEIIFYTDGITEAHNPQGQMFGTGRLDALLEGCPMHAEGLLAAILGAVNEFTAGQPADDDRTLVIARVR